MHNPELWGGIECTVNRVRGSWFSQLARTGHDRRADDIDRIARLGIRTVRYPVLWELTAPDAPDELHWEWPDARLARIRAASLTPIVGLLHHGSGPRYTSLIDPSFSAQLADFAGQVARRYPWVQCYTPVNEPLTTARFSGLYGLWYPHGRDDRTFVRALLNQCRAIVLAMQAIRDVNPDARLIQTEDFGHTYATPHMRYQAAFDNERRWLSWDLLCGIVGASHPLRGFLIDSGASDSELDWLSRNPCPPDVIGINHYVTSDRFLDERLERYPATAWGSNGKERYADIDAVRVLHYPPEQWRNVLRDISKRYALPVAITEVHLGCTREEQLRWLHEAWNAAREAMAEGVDVRAVTAWSLFGCFDWNTLLTAGSDHYEPGAFDVRGPEPRATALAALIRSLAAGAEGTHPALEGPGWWRRPLRLLYAPHEIEPAPPDIQHHTCSSAAQPLLIMGADGALRRTLATSCERRGLSHHSWIQSLLDFGDVTALHAILDRLRPWGVLHAQRGHTAPALSRALASRGVALLTLDEHTSDSIEFALDRFVDAFSTHAPARSAVAVTER